jgi:Leucine-rich repeat (LRR) protein
MATFITSKSIGQTINISVQTSTGYWKYNHNGTDSGVFGNGSRTITVANDNGEFTIISCLSNGTVSGNITQLNLSNNQLTSFDGTDLSGLTTLNLYGNQLTSFDGTDLSGLTDLFLAINQLTSLDVLPMISLTDLYLTDPYGLNGNPMTATANNTILSGLVTNGLASGNFYTSGGRTAAGTADYDTLIGEGWNLLGLDLVITSSGKLRVKGVGQINQ